MDDQERDEFLDSHRGMYFDKQGREISLRQWSRLRDGTTLYYRVAETMLGEIWVSTVWIGISIRLMPGPPGDLFETMAFDHRVSSAEDGAAEFPDFTRRYSTEQDALDGHQEVVAEVGIYLDLSSTAWPGKLP